MARDGRRMAEGIHYSVTDRVAFLSIDHPPVNSLSHAVRAGLMAALDRAEADTSVEVVVLLGTGSTFPAGSDLTEYQSGLKAPFLRDLCDRVEAMPKPVIAALHGTAFGGGLELALAADYRIAQPGTRMGLPEIRMGLPPSAGATQRLPRLLPTAQALHLLTTGGSVIADRGVGRGLVDEIVDGDLRTAALAFRDTLPTGTAALRPTRDRMDMLADYAGYAQAIAKYRSALAKDDSHAGQAHVIDLVEAVPLLPFEAGLGMEQDAFESCLASEAAQALRHAFTAERSARRFALPQDIAPPQIDRIAVLGQGPLAMQIAVSALNAGLGVNWGAHDAEALGEGVEQLREIFATGVKGGGLSQEQSKARLELLNHGSSADMIDGADIVIHAARGQGSVPAPEGTVRAVAMSSRVDALGLRFAPPVFSTRLVEIVEGPVCSAEQVAYGRALAERMNKVPVHVKSRGDSIAGRLAAALHRAADALLDMGADPYEVDDAVEHWGWGRPPFRTRDMRGLQDLAKAQRAEGADNWSALLIAEGREGWVAGRGFYNWTDDGAERAGVVKRLLNARRDPQTFDPDHIVHILIAAVANEGARLLQSGMAQKASDIDAVAILALDFPRVKGGPMMAAGQMGMLKLMKLLERMDHPDRAFWTPTPDWAEHIKYGRSFVSQP
ncbi:enoyl-CoA hydratase-related protein [Sagittula sp. SSi028]|uniref:enoyl-CoA hydratase-related protein n=1 Tax=Sagittula sp. SSi028 TaxID=3400636 RepID=UPI003AF5EB78